MAPRHLLLLVAVTAMWGFNTVPAAIAVQFLPPLWLACSRFAVMGAPSVARRLERKYWVATAVYGISTFAIPFSLYYEALRLGMPPGAAAVVGQTHLLWSLMLSRGVLGERVGLIGWAGCLLAFAGIVLLSWPGAGASLPLIGVAFGLIGAFSSAVGNIAIRRAPGISNVALNVWGSVIALPVVLVVAWALEGDPSQQMGVAFSTPAFVAAFAFQALVGSALCFPAWTRMIAKYGVSRVTPFTLLVPLFAVASTTLFLGEQWTPRMLAALAIVVAGLSVVQLLPRFVRA